MLFIAAVAFSNDLRLYSAAFLAEARALGGDLRDSTTASTLPLANSVGFVEALVLFSIAVLA